jgi:hypothetical protein
MGADAVLPEIGGQIAAMDKMNDTFKGLWVVSQDGAWSTPMVCEDSL